MRQELECFIRNDHEYMLQYMLLFLRETKKHKENIETVSKYLTYVIKLLSILWKR